MDKSKLIEELEKKKKELEELEKVLQEVEEKEKPVYEINKSEILKEIKNFSRYYINLKGEIFHEIGVQLPVIEKENKQYVKLFDDVNNLIEISIEDLLKNNF